jgi:PAS domain S-box-containing protein
LGARARRLAVLATAQQQLAGVRSLEALPTAVRDAIRLVAPQASSVDIREMLEGHHAEPGPHLHRVGDTLELCLPLAEGDRPTRRLCVRTTEAVGFDPQDVDLLRILARHALQALETARLIEAQELERQHVEAAAEIARVALDARTLRQGAEGVLAVIARLAPSDGMALGVARARDGRLVYEIATGVLAGLQGYQPPGSHGVLGLSPDGDAVIVPDLRAEAPSAMQDRIPAVPVLVLPLLARGHAVGALLLASAARPPFPASVRDTLSRLSASLALAIDANLLDEEEQQARSREQILAAALMTLDHPVFIVDGERIRFANPAASREYGYPAAELVGRPFAELVVTASPDSPWSVLSAGTALASADDPEPAHVHRRRDGSEFPAAVAVNPLRDAAARTIGAVVSVRDLTADRALAEQLRHSEKMVALGELVAGVAHEINNPLTGISAFAELLLEEALAPEQQESVELIKRESERATAVIRDLLLFARKGEAPVGPVDLNALVEQTLRLRGYALRSAGIDVQTDLDPSLPSVPGDSHKLQQVLLNLVSNAEHAMAPARMDGRTDRVLTVRSRRHDRHAVVTIEDSGCGMAPTVKRRLFEPFFTTKPPGVGTGLGLSVSYGIAQAHGGTLAVESEEGVGTCVTLTVPTTRNAPRDPEPARQRFAGEPTED